MDGSLEETMNERLGRVLAATNVADAADEDGPETSCPNLFVGTSNVREVVRFCSSSFSLSMLAAADFSFWDIMVVKFS